MKYQGYADFQAAHTLAKYAAYFDSRKQHGLSERNLKGLKGTLTMAKTKTLQACSICGGPIAIEIGGWASGHNAEPVNHGRCCSACNEQVVIPMRIQRMLDHLPMREVRQDKGNDSQ